MQFHCNSTRNDFSNSVFWVITQRKVFGTDVSGLHIGPIFKGQLLHYLSFPTSSVKLSFLESLTLEMEPLGSAETSVSNHLTSRNDREDGRI